MQRPRFVAAQNEAGVRRLCNIDRPIEACTRFVDFALTADCIASDEQWMIMASARILPLIVILVPDAMAHEYVHISDMRQSASKYLRDVRRPRYSTKTICEDAAAREIAGFGLRLRRFAEASTALRHPAAGRGR
jgi:hypothetical protein